MYTFKSNKFEIGDSVMWKADYTKEIYTVVNPYIQSRDRVVIKSRRGEVIRASQNTLRKLSRAELSVCNAYRKLVEDVDKGQ